MTLTCTNPRRKKGFTLIEVLAVVSIIAILMAAAASPFVYALNSYKGQYALESSQIEAHRAVAEFTAYGRRSAYYEVPVIVGGAPTYAFRFVDAVDSKITFIFSQTAVQVDGWLVGTLDLVTPTASYRYVGQWVVPPTGPFKVSQGGVAFYFRIYSAGAPVSFQTFVNSTSL